MFNNNLVEKQKYKSLHYLRQLKAIMAARETKAKSIHFRNKLLERQKVANYQNELDRMKGVLTQAELKGLTAGAFKSRSEKLESMIKEIKKNIMKSNYNYIQCLV